jgi:GTP-binding protein EngB required for normal cell division
MKSHAEFPAVVFFGIIGQGIRRLKKLLWGSYYESPMTAQGCTRRQLFEISLRNGIRVLDTPEFDSPEDIKNHIDQNKIAVERTALSGIYAVVKLGKVAQMVEILCKVMNFVGEDDIRIVIVVMGHAPQEPDCNMDRTKEQLSHLLAVRESNIFAIGMDTSADDVESFIESTLHNPRCLKVIKDHIAFMSELTSGTIKSHQDLEEIKTNLDAAKQVSQTFLLGPGGCGHTSMKNDANHRRTRALMTENKTDAAQGRVAQHSSMSGQTMRSTKFHQDLEEINTYVDAVKQASHTRLTGPGRGGHASSKNEANHRDTSMLRAGDKTDLVRGREVRATKFHQDREEIRSNVEAAKQASQACLPGPCRGGHTSMKNDANHDHTRTLITGDKTDFFQDGEAQHASLSSRTIIGTKHHQDLEVSDTRFNDAKNISQILVQQPKPCQTMKIQNKSPAVVFFGKVGHGKTRITNLLCGTKYASKMTAQSCTRQVQIGETRRSGIHVIDTPGFYSAEDIKNHIDQQKRAIEQTAISGIYAVVKYGRVDEMAETLNKIMDFVGEDDIRIFITFADNALQETGCIIDETRERLSQLLEVRLDNILAVGIDTRADDVESFVESTLHQPKYFQVSKEQHAYMSSQTSGARKYHQDLEEIRTKVDVAEQACQTLLQEPCSGQTNMIVEATLKKTRMMMEEAKSEILYDAEELPLEEQESLRSKLMSLVVRSDERFRNLIQGHQYSYRSYWHSDVPLVQVEFIKSNSTWCIQYLMNSTSLTPLELHKKLHDLDILNQNKRGQKRGQDSVNQEEVRYSSTYSRPVKKREKTCYCDFCSGICSIM